MNKICCNVSASEGTNHVCSDHYWAALYFNEQWTYIYLEAASLVN